MLHVRRPFGQTLLGAIVTPRVKRAMDASKQCPSDVRWMCFRPRFRSLVSTHQLRGREGKFRLGGTKRERRPLRSIISSWAWGTQLSGLLKRDGPGSSGERTGNLSKDSVLQSVGESGLTWAGRAARQGHYISVLVIEKVSASVEYSRKHSRRHRATAIRVCFFASTRAQLNGFQSMERGHSDHGRAPSDG